LLREKSVTFKLLMVILLILSGVLCAVSIIVIINNSISVLSILLMSAMGIVFILVLFVNCIMIYMKCCSERVVPTVPPVPTVTAPTVIPAIVAATVSRASKAPDLETGKFTGINPLRA